MRSIRENAKYRNRRTLETKICFHVFKKLQTYFSYLKIHHINVLFITDTLGINKTTKDIKGIDLALVQSKNKYGTFFGDINEPKKL